MEGSSISMSLTTPALLFPAISLLLLAYTNRFLVLAQVIRELNHSAEEDTREMVLRQIKSLKQRIWLVKFMQSFGCFSFLLCTCSMFALYLHYQLTGQWLFGISLICLCVSLFLSFYEIVISTDAIKVELENFRLKDH